MPEKPCATCGRPFTWRKKWARDWEAVRHCSDACRRARRTEEKKSEKSVPDRLARPAHRG
nr:DUF2256 domain-containing protein [Pararoseomonas indoligenes]